MIPASICGRRAVWWMDPSGPPSRLEGDEHHEGHEEHEGARKQPEPAMMGGAPAVEPGVGERLQLRVVPGPPMAGSSPATP